MFVNLFNSGRRTRSVVQLGSAALNCAKDRETQGQGSNREKRVHARFALRCQVPRRGRKQRIHQREQDDPVASARVQGVHHDGGHEEDYGG